MRNLARLQPPLVSEGAVCMDWSLDYVHQFKNCQQPFNFKYSKIETVFDISSRVIKGDWSTGLIHVPEALFDLVLATEVFEHVPVFWEAARALQRIVKPRGVLIYSVPFMYMYHPVPGDYWRQTLQGALFLLETHGFRACLMSSSGSRAAYSNMLGFGTADFKNSEEIMYRPQNRTAEVFFQATDYYLVLVRSVSGIPLGRQCSAVVPQLDSLDPRNEIPREWLRLKRFISD